MTLAQAIARQEGFGKEGTRPTRNNNPGDLTYGTLTRRYGATMGDPRYAIFRKVEDGWAAMEALIENNRDKTVSQLIRKVWAPATENDCDTYIKNVCEWTGLSPESIINHG